MTCGCVPMLAIINSSKYCWKWKTSSTNVATLVETNGIIIWCTDLTRFIAILAIVFVCTRYMKIMNVIVASITSIHNYICILCPKKGEDYLQTWVPVLLDGERNLQQNRCQILFPISNISGKDGPSWTSTSRVYHQQAKVHNIGYRSSLLWV